MLCDYKRKIMKLNLEEFIENYPIFQKRVIQLKNPYKADYELSNYEIFYIIKQVLREIPDRRYICWIKEDDIFELIVVEVIK